MTKSEFLAALESGLAALPREDREKTLDYYSEMIDDRIEEGMSEREAVEAVGNAEELAAGIVAEAAPAEPEPAQTEEPEPRRGMGAWTIALLILGSPVWLPLLIAGASIVFAVYVVMWSVVIALYAMTLGFAAGALGGVLGGIVHLVSGNLAQTPMLVGAGLACAGFAILAFHLSNLAARGVIYAGKRIAQWIGGKAKAVGRRAAPQGGGFEERKETV